MKIEYVAWAITVILGLAATAIIVTFLFYVLP